MAVGAARGLEAVGWFIRVVRHVSPTTSVAPSRQIHQALASCSPFRQTHHLEQFSEIAADLSAKEFKTGAQSELNQTLFDLVKLGFGNAAVV